MGGDYRSNGSTCRPLETLSKTKSGQDSNTHTTEGFFLLETRTAGQTNKQTTGTGSREQKKPATAFRDLHRHSERPSAPGSPTNPEMKKKRVWKGPIVSIAPMPYSKYFIRPSSQ